jgi:hypothetical protein
MPTLFTGISIHKFRARVREETWPKQWMHIVLNLK